MIFTEESVLPPRCSRTKSCVYVQCIYLCVYVCVCLGGEKRISILHSCNIWYVTAFPELMNIGDASAGYCNWDSAVNHLSTVRCCWDFNEALQINWGSCGSTDADSISSEEKTHAYEVMMIWFVFWSVYWQLHILYGSRAELKNLPFGKVDESNCRGTKIWLKTKPPQVMKRRYLSYWGRRFLAQGRTAERNRSKD